MEHPNPSRWQMLSLLLLRVLIGWHFLHEGMVKLLNDQWTSASYLKDSKWLLSGFFHTIAENPTFLKTVDVINIWALIAIGLCLIAGFLTSYATISGIFLLSLYYIASIPLPGLAYSTPVEGNYLIVNKILIEMAALFVLFMFHSHMYYGLDKFLKPTKPDMK